MANVIYVANYPYDFSDGDIMEIFKDFEGLLLLRSLRKNRKCYSFILCRNQEQVIEIVFSYNGIDVGGRNLIVRASDDELQEIIDQCGGDDNYDSYGVVGRDEETICPSERQPHYLESSYRQPRKPSRLASAKVIVDSLSKESIETKNSNIGVLRERSDASEADVLANPYEASCSETSSFRSFSPCSVASSCRRQGRKEKFSFVSIVNFPDGTTTEELQEMFSEFKPFRIIIQNQVAEDDVPTEAVICFLKDKDATNSIISLDNTLYRGRVVLVTECDDISLISDLIKVNHC